MKTGPMAQVKFNGFDGEDIRAFCSNGVLQNIKFQAPNYKQISNSNTQ
jgi:hypothetical protein